MSVCLLTWCELTDHFFISLSLVPHSFFSHSPFSWPLALHICFGPKWVHLVFPSWSLSNWWSSLNHVTGVFQSWLHVEWRKNVEVLTTCIAGVFIAAMKRSIKLFLTWLYCMTRIFNSVYEVLFKMEFQFGVWHGPTGSRKFPFRSPPPAGCGSIFISHIFIYHDAPDASQWLLIRSTDASSVCVCDRGGGSRSKHRQKDSWHLKYGWNVFAYVHVCVLFKLLCTVFLYNWYLFVQNISMENVYCWW